MRFWHIVTLALGTVGKLFTSASASETIAILSSEMGTNYDRYHSVDDACNRFELRDKGSITDFNEGAVVRSFGPGSTYPKLREEDYQLGIEYGCPKKNVFPEPCKKIAELQEYYAQFYRNENAVPFWAQENQKRANAFVTILYRAKENCEKLFWGTVQTLDQMGDSAEAAICSAANRENRPKP